MPVFSMRKIKQTAAELVNLMADKDMKFTEAMKTLETAQKLLYSNMNISKVESVHNESLLTDEFINDFEQN